MRYQSAHAEADELREIFWKMVRVEFDLHQVSKIGVCEGSQVITCPEPEEKTISLYASIAASMIEHLGGLDDGIFSSEHIEELDLSGLFQRRR